MYGMPNLSLGKIYFVWIVVRKFGWPLLYVFVSVVRLGQARFKSEDIERTADVFEVYQVHEAKD